MAYIIGYNPAAPVGQRLAPEVRTEIALLAPVTLPNGSVTNPRIADQAVDERTVRDNTIRDTHIQPAAVRPQHIAPAAVVREHIAPAQIDDTHIDRGVPTVVDQDDQPIRLRIVPLTAAEYASRTPDPDVMYFVR